MQQSSVFRNLNLASTREGMVAPAPTGKGNLCNLAKLVVFGPHTILTIYDI